MRLQIQFQMQMKLLSLQRLRFFQWRVAASSKTCHYVGRAYGRSITIYDRLRKGTYTQNT